jgi:hypothetical protein
MKSSRTGGRDYRRREFHKIKAIESLYIFKNTRMISTGSQVFAGGEA